MFLYAIDNGLDLPVGALDAVSLNPREDDKRDADAPDTTSDNSSTRPIYEIYVNADATRFKWVRPKFFTPLLRKHLADDVGRLRAVLRLAGDWSAERDSKLSTLIALLAQRADEKVLVFSQFADTVEYLVDQLTGYVGKAIGAATSTATNPTLLAQRFSPTSNNLSTPSEDKCAQRQPTLSAANYAPGSKIPHLPNW